jgi:hypothetical protein
MFTVLSNTRNSNLYLIASLAIVMIVLVTLAVAPTISAPKSVAISVTSSSEVASDYFQRHPEWTFSGQTVAIPMTSSFEGSDFFLRHPELRTANTTIDLSDYFQRH